MKDHQTFVKLGILAFMAVVITVLVSSCKKESSFKTPPLVGSEINEEKIKESVGCSFDIIKTETIGYFPTHKFLWVCLDSDLDKIALENLAQAIIQDIIDRKPATFHSFTIHFFNREDLAQTVEESNPFAKAEYLPEGGLAEVGRVAIEEHENYQLILSLSNQ